MSGAALKEEPDGTGFTGLADVFILFILLILSEPLLYSASAKDEPQMKAPRVTPLEGVSTYALRSIRVRGVENPQGFGIDERRFIVPGLYVSWRGAGSPPAGLRLWRRAEGRGWGLKQFQQIFPAQTCLVKNINKCPCREFLVQRYDGSIGCLMCDLLKRYMAALLPDFNESCLFKRSNEFFP